MLELRVEKGAPVGRVAFPVDWSLEVLVRVVAVAVAVGVLDEASLPSLPRGVRVLRVRTPGIVMIGRYSWYKLVQLVALVATAIAESSQDVDVWKAELRVESCGKRDWIEDGAREGTAPGFGIKRRRATRKVAVTRRVPSNPRQEATPSRPVVATVLACLFYFCPCTLHAAHCPHAFWLINCWHEVYRAVDRDK